MARKVIQIGDMFANSDSRDIFIASALEAENKLSVVQNPYVGNKRKILADLAISLYDVLDFENINTICDLFSGSAFVSATFKMLNKKVYCNDLLASSYLNAISLLRNSEYPFSKNEWDFLIKNERNERTNLHFVESNYSNIRFTEKESKFIDNFYANSLELIGTPLKMDSTINPVSFVKSAVAHTSLIHFIMNYCFLGGRLNSGQVLASLKHRLEHQRNNNCQIPFHNMKPFSFPMSGPVSECHHGDVLDFLKKNNVFDLIYIDPPYGGQQSDYAFMYQFFEEYLNQTSIENIDYLSSSKKFVKAKTYKDSFEKLLYSLPVSSAWAISYNDSSWADINTITNMISKYKNNIKVKEIDYSYKYRSSENSSGTEYLIVGQ